MSPIIYRLWTCFSKVLVAFRARKLKLFCVCRIYIQIQSFNNFDNDTMKISANEAKFTGAWARKGATIKQVWILKFAFGPQKFPCLSKDRPPGS